MKNGSMLRMPALLAAACLMLHASAHAEDRAAERAQRRLQLQLQGLQLQLQEAQGARDKAEGARADLAKRQQQDEAELARATAARQRLQSDLKSEQAQRAALSAQLADLERRLAEQQRAGDDALRAKDAELAQLVKQRDAEQLRLQGRYAEQVRMVEECSDKNQRLSKLSRELIERYKSKGVIDALKQRDPLLGLSEVDMFNSAQDARDRADAERFRPSANQ